MALSPIYFIDNHESISPINGNVETTQMVLWVVRYSNIFSAILATTKTKKPVMIPIHAPAIKIRWIRFSLCLSSLKGSTTIINITL